MRLPAPLHVYLLRHVQVALNSLGRLYRAPLASLMTAAVIGIALALPSALYALTVNLQRLGSQWDGGASLSLFLRQDVSLDQARALEKKLRQWPEIGRLRLITPQQALEEFRQLSGFGDTLDLLDKNPLPAVLAVTPAPGAADATAAAGLMQRLQALAEVDLAQLDLQWVKRFQAMVDLVQRAIWVLSGLLGLAVLLITGNTIRLEIQNRREEIEITKLIGATSAFIRRPFLYSGLWYGLGGALLAASLLALAFFQFSGPVRQLATLYESSFRLQMLSPSGWLALLLAGAVLGLLGAWLAVSRHLAAIEPS